MRSKSSFRGCRVKKVVRERLRVALINWVKQKALGMAFKRLWFKRWRWLIVLVPLGGFFQGCVPDVWAQSFTVDVDYQLQRQYKAPLMKHEVFTNAQELAAYVAGGEATRAYEGQIVVLVEDGETYAYTIGRDESGLIALAIGSAPEDWSVYAAAADLDMAGIASRERRMWSQLLA
jgi:hypothetical protein